MAGKKVQTDSPVVYWCERRYEQLKVCFASSDKGAVMVGISFAKDGVDCFSYFRDEIPGPVLWEDPSVNAGLIEAVEAALSDRPGPDLPLDLDATPFQQAVWRAIARIPYGSTRTYGEVARMVGSPLAARAIGQTMGQNPLPLLFP